MSTHNIGFYEDLTKIIFELSSNIIKYAPYFFCWAHNQKSSYIQCIIQKTNLSKTDHLYFAHVKIINIMKIMSKTCCMFQIPEYCRNMEESDIVDQAFPLIFAFDEIVALGYRENVNLAQIRTFTEMDSHEEKVFLAVKQVSPVLIKPIIKPIARNLFSGLTTGVDSYQSGQLQKVVRSLKFWI